MTTQENSAVDWGAEDAAADREHREFLKQLNRNRANGVPDGIQNFEPSIVLSVMDELKQIMTTRDMSKLIGVDERRIRDFYTVNKTVRAEIVEKVYIAAGRVEELNEILPTYTTPGWSKYGDCCGSCGTYWRKHYAEGLCYRCHREMSYLIERDTVPTEICVPATM